MKSLFSQRVQQKVFISLELNSKQTPGLPHWAVLISFDCLEVFSFVQQEIIYDSKQSMCLYLKDELTALVWLYFFKKKPRYMISSKGVLLYFDLEDAVCVY